MFLDIEFSKLFKDKHGKKIYGEIISKIEQKKAMNCDNNYIEAIFRVAFLGYFGLDENALNNMLKDIECKDDISHINKIHKNSITTIRDYITKTNSENKITDI